MVVFTSNLSENKGMIGQRGARAVASICGVLVLLACPSVFAQTAPQSSSSSYSVDQVYFGGGSQLNACSAHFCSKQTVGDTAVGNAAGTAFQTIAGTNTDRDPYIAFSTSGGTTDLGILSTAGTATATATFAVKTYLANGYVVTLASDPPSNGTGGHIFNAPSSPTAAAAPGTTEQFGINLAVNTTGCGSPANMGAAPVQVPSGTFSYGTVATGYDTFRSYTISFIYNITQVTPNGDYVFNGDLVATSTY
jgi:hypothetical protein